ncbi:MAG: hypothetical protein ACYCVB_19525, partial [Bacilli bacterium]
MPNAEITLVAVFFAGLIFTVQHISERYSPILAKHLLRNWIIYVPVGVMSIAVVYSRFISRDAVIIDNSLFVGFIFSIYGALYMAFDQRMLIRLVRRSKASDRIICYEDCLSGAMSRMDERIAELVWREIDQGSCTEKVKREILLWAIDDDRFLTVSWAFEKLYRVLIPFALRTTTDTQDHVFHVLSRQLDRNLFDLAEGFVDCALQELKKNSAEWTSDTWEFIYYLGNTLWLKGHEEGVRDVIPRLDSLHRRYIGSVYGWIHIVLDSKRTELVEGLTQAIGELMEDITFTNG